MGEEEEEQEGGRGMRSSAVVPPMTEAPSLALPFLHAALLLRFQAASPPPSHPLFLFFIIPSFFP